MSACDLFVIGATGFDGAYAGIAATAGEEFPAPVYCGHKHPDFPAAHACANELREALYVKHLERLAWLASRPKAQLWITVNGEIGDEYDEYQPSLTKGHRDADHNYEHMRENEG